MRFAKQEEAMFSNAFRVVLVASLASGLVGCGMTVDGSEEGAEDVGQVAAALEVCVSPAVNSGNVCNLGGGQLKLQVTLPTGQQYVEVFARQNGVQNVAVAIQGSGLNNGNGTTTYSLTRSGYAATDQVEYRFYSYKPSAPGVFTPGPAEAAWYGYVASVPVTKDAAVVYNSYGLGYVPNQNFGSSTSVDIGEYQLTSEGLFGYGLAAIPAGATVTKAELVIPSTAYAPIAANVNMVLNKVTSAWSESTVTWNTKPSYALLGNVVVNHAAETRLDVTGTVGGALAAGEVSFALQPSAASPTTDNVFIQSKENTSVGAQRTSLTVSYRR
jgi:hypothetical protein